ncbi:S-layer homology domain-containing protein, partial [Neglectibacter sp. 59]|uniref:S-layer homology domain-containing protein n=2 Tax=unclassified Neglectibacter TaxID=2632164 RepID=UPI0014121132
MIAAMIPLSAAAASAPTVYVGGTKIDFSSGNSQSVTVSSSSVAIGWDWPADGSTQLYVVQKDSTEVRVADKAAAAGTTLDLAAHYNADADGVYTVPLLLKEKNENDVYVTVGEYTLLVKVDEADINKDTSIKEVAGLTGMVTYTIADDKIIVVLPFGKTYTDAGLNGALDEDNFKPTVDEATIDFTAATATANAIVKVTAKGGMAVKEYEVVVENQTGIATFSVPTQTADAEIDNSGKTIDVNVSVDTDLTKVVPTFTLGETVDRVTCEKGGGSTDVVNVISGETALNFTSGGTTKEARTFDVILKDGTSVVVTVDLTKAEGSEAVLKAIQVGTSARTEVSGDTVTVTMGAKEDFKDAVTVVAEVSTNAEVVILSQKGVAFTTAGNIATSATNAVDISGKTFVLRVTAEDGKAHKDYTINLVAAGESEKKLTDFTIKKGADSYSAVWSTDGMTGTITLPFKLKSDAALADFVIYATPSAGASVTMIDSAGSGTKAIENGKTKYSEVKAFVINQNQGLVTVIADDNSKSTYTIKLRFEDPRQESKLLGAEAVNTAEVPNITADWTFKAAVKEVTTSTDTKEQGVELTIPDSTAVTENAYFKTLTLSPGAKAYFVNAGDTAVEEVKALDPDIISQQTVKGITLDANFVGAFAGNKLTLADAKALYVVNEKETGTAEAISADATDALTDLVDAGDAHVYYVYAVKAPAEKGTKLLSLTSDSDKNVTVAKKGDTYTITVPNSYSDGSTAFGLNFSVSRLATLAADDPAKAGTLLTDWESDGGKKGEGTQFVMDSGELKDNSNSETVTDDGAGLLTVTAEDGTSTESYKLVVKVAEKEKGAAIKSLKVGNTAATISGKTINLTLPFGTELYPVKLDITADKMAAVEINGVPYNSTNNYNLNSDLTIKVTSEDQATVNVYTLKTKLGERFSDVPADAWFAPYVEQAFDAGIVKGRGDGVFGPYDTITREDFAVMTVRMLGVEVDENATVPFKDEASVS